MLSIIFSTYNGAGTLPMMFDAMERVRVPKGGWKIIVADNASTDNTREIIFSWRNRLPIEYVCEEKRGQNPARNKALSLIEGDLVVFTDDDVLPAEDWLEKLVALANNKPEITGFGGRITPYWQAEVPEWIPRLVPFGPVFAVTNPGLSSREVGPECCWGPNFMLRSSLFREGYTFDDTVGPDGSPTYRMGSETSLLRRLHKEGHRFWFCPDAMVQHIIRPHQLDRDWILQRAYRLGRSIYHAEKEAQFGCAAMFAGVPRWRIGKYLRNRVLYPFARITGDFDKTFSVSWEIKFFEGYWFEKNMASH